MPISAKAIQAAFRDVGPVEAKALSQAIRDNEGWGTSGRKVENVLELANKVIDGSGWEVIDGDGPGGFWQDAVLAYVNTGDTYNMTIYYDTDKQRFYLGDWGSWVERNGKKRGVQ